MNRCERTRAHLDDWLDDRLGQADRDDVETHLRECRDCEAFFAQHRTLAADLATLGGAADRIAAVPVAPKRRRASRLGATLLRIAAGVVLMTTAGLFVAQYAGGPGRDSTGFVQNDLPGDGETLHAEGPRFHSTHEADRIVVPIKCENPRVHIVWLYDTPGRDGPSGSEEDGEKPV